jgi:LPPG:FO 2-phospho-L-lactate transferase
VTQLKTGQVVALAGGVGGAKLALGLYRYLQNQAQAAQLTIIGNTGDDLEMFGLRICPDLDTLLYTLAGLANPETGWGMQGDTFNTLTMLKEYGEAGWFWLGDRDFATHILRSQWLQDGQSLTQVTATLASRLGLECQLLPMANEDVRTLVQTEEAGELSFQDYFVRRHAQDTVQGLNFAGATQASLSPEVRQTLTQAKLIIICPSNPYLSIWPILSIAGLRELLEAAREQGTTIVAVSPIVGGSALKGPAAQIMQSLGAEVSAFGVAQLYQKLATAFVLDSVDATQTMSIQQLGLQTLVADTIMKTEEDKIRLAATILAHFG